LTDYQEGKGGKRRKRAFWVTL
jgi:hypothetical protein